LIACKFIFDDFLNRGYYLIYGFCEAKGTQPCLRQGLEGRRSRWRLFISANVARLARNPAKPGFCEAKSRPDKKLRFLEF